MAHPKLTFPIACLAVSLLTQGCVEYYPAPAEAGPPPPPMPPQGEYAPPPAYAPPQEPPVPAPYASAPNASLDALVGPIALYPDPLVALILPAATVPEDIAAASSYLVQYGDVSQIDSQPWDPSVRALAHYPTVVSWMAQNMAWTQALGSAFINSPSDVMSSIQSLRARARANGSLVSNPEQQIVEADSDIEILPAQPDFVYVPSYDPDVVYADGYYGGYDGPFFNYGPAYPAGIWLSYSFDWRRHRVWQGDRNDWHPHQGWHPPHGGGSPPPGAQPWNPKPRGPRADIPPPSRGPAPRPRPMQGAPNPPPAPKRQPGHPLTGQPGHPVERQPAPDAGQIVRSPVQTQSGSRVTPPPAGQPGHPAESPAPQAGPVVRSPIQPPPAPRTTPPPLDRPRLPSEITRGLATPPPPAREEQHQPNSGTHAAAPEAGQHPATIAPSRETGPAPSVQGPGRSSPEHPSQAEHEHAPARAEPARAAPAPAPAAAPTPDNKNH